MSIFAAFFLNLFSGFGQTYLVTLVMPYLLRDTALSRPDFAWAYGLATLTAAGLLMRFGRWSDKYPIRRMLLFSVLGIAVSLYGLVHVTQVMGLFGALMGLRFFSQSMLPHLAASLAVKTASRRRRGRLLSLSSLGHPAGQLLLPVLFVGLTRATDWRLALAVLFSLFLPLLAVFWKSWNAPPANPVKKSGPGVKIPWKEWVTAGGIPLLLNLVATPFLCTALLLQLDVIGTTWGWGTGWEAGALAAFAMANAGGMLLGGFGIDRFGTPAMTAVYLWPMALGCFAAAWGGSLWVGLLFMGLVGFTSGLSHPVKIAILAHHFGRERFGAARGFSGALVVLATAVSPPIYAALVDAGIRPSFWLAASGFGALLLTRIKKKDWPDESNS